MSQPAPEIQKKVNPERFDHCSHWRNQTCVSLTPEIKFHFTCALLQQSCSVLDLGYKDCLCFFLFFIVFMVCSLSLWQQAWIKFASPNQTAITKIVLQQCLLREKDTGVKPWQTRQSLDPLSLFLTYTQAINCLTTLIEFCTLLLILNYRLNYNYIFVPLFFYKKKKTVLLNINSGDISVTHVKWYDLQWFVCEAYFSTQLSNEVKAPEQQSIMQTTVWPWRCQKLQTAIQSTLSRHLTFPNILSDIRLHHW